MSSQRVCNYLCPLLSSELPASESDQRSIFFLLSLLRIENFLFLQVSFKSIEVFYVKHLVKTWIKLAEKTYTPVPVLQ